MKRYQNLSLSPISMSEADEGEWIKYSDIKNNLEIVYKSIITEDYLVAVDLLSEILEGNNA